MSKKWSRVTAIKTKIWECSTLPLMRISVAALFFFVQKAPQDAMTFCKIPQEFAKGCIALSIAEGYNMV